jgi:hypothetical protein
VWGASIGATFGRMLDVPLLALFAVFAGLAYAEWTRLPLCARVSLAGAGVFAIGAVKYPGQGVGAVVAHTDDGLVYLVTVARGACAAVLMISAIATLRALLSR